MKPEFKVWISNGKQIKTNEKYGAFAPYFRKLFSGKGIKKATLYITAQGIFKAYINGNALSEDRFQPEWTDYSVSLNYTRYDLTAQIKDENCLGIILGNGWYCGTVGLLNVRANYGDNPSFSAEIHLEREGETEIICTDSSW